MIRKFVVYQDPTGCLMAFRFNPFEVRDDSNPLGDGLPHLSRIKLGGAATAGIRARFSTGDDYNHTYFQINTLSPIKDYRWLYKSTSRL